MKTFGFVLPLLLPVVADREEMRNLVRALFPCPRDFITAVLAPAECPYNNVNSIATVAGSGAGDGHSTAVNSANLR